MRIVIFKELVDRQDVTEDMWFWVGVIAHMHYWQTLKPLRVTSLYRDGDPHAHGRGEAVDISRYAMKTGVAIAFCREIQEKFGAWLGVQLEPEWGKGTRYTGPHIHLQLKKRRLCCPSAMTPVTA